MPSNRENVEIRPIVASEALAYLRVLPFYNGLPQWEPAPAAWYGGEAAWGPRTPMGERELRACAGRLLADDLHPQAAFVDGRLVGGSAMLSLQVTAPGPRPVAMAGVTDTGVAATHRRRGLLRSMMQAMFDGALQRGDAVAGLSASEGGIYGRFGFAPATLRARWEIERAAARFRDDRPAVGSLELVGAPAAREAWPAIHEAVRRRRVGEVSARAGRWAELTDEPRGTDGPLRHLLHRDPDGRVDGIADFQLPWSAEVHDAGTLVVAALEATTAAAYRELWALLLDFDLTRRIVAAPRPHDEPLRWMLADPRAMRVTRQSDNLWIRLLDVGGALTARGYGSSGTLVFAIGSDPMCPSNEGRWRLQVDGGQARCERCEDSPELTVDVRALGALYLGGGSAALLGAAGLIAEHRPGAVDELSRLLRCDPAPYNAVGF